jgi:hypothetical protein
MLLHFCTHLIVQGEKLTNIDLIIFYANYRWWSLSSLLLNIMFIVWPYLDNQSAIVTTSAFEHVYIKDSSLLCCQQVQLHLLVPTHYPSKKFASQYHINYSWRDRNQMRTRWARAHSKTEHLSVRYGDTPLSFVEKLFSLPPLQLNICFCHVVTILWGILIWFSI